MKIGVLIDKLNIGGVVKIAIQEVRALKAMNLDATLIVLSRKAGIEEAFSDLLKDIPIEYLEDRLPRFFRFSFKIPFFYFFSFFHLSYPFLIPFVVKKREYDFLLSHNTYTSFTAFTLSKINSIPYIIYVYDPISYIIKKAYPKGPIKWMGVLFVGLANILDKLIVEHADSVLVQGDLHYNHLKKMLGSIEKLVILPPAYNYAEQLATSRGEYILAVSAWKEGKEVENLLQLVSEIEDAHLKIVGKWIHNDYRKRIDIYISKLGLLDRVEIIGETTEEKLNSFYREARVAVIINNERGLGMSALEAASNGCTFIIPSECGICRYFKDKKDGFYFTYGDTNTAKQYLEELLKNERLAYNMGRHAWKTVKEHYGWRKHAEVIIKCMQR